MKNLFQQWYEQADMPMQLDNEQWIDKEGGISYEDFAKSVGKEQNEKALSKAAEARKTAKFFGAIALTGTPKQKAWAEKIRESKIANMTEEQAKMACDRNSILRTAKIWIENRNKTSQEFVDFLERKAQLMAAFAAANSQEEREKIAAEHNDLTATWGL